MIYALYAELNDSNIKSNLGRPQYSYYFLLKSFRRVLGNLGKVKIVEDPATQVDKLYLESRSRGEDCLFICFTPPHLAPTDLRCPTLCLFAWEFSTIPCASWDGNPANDWRWVFSHHVGVITTSSHTADVVRAAMTEHSRTTPVLSIPAPTWDDFAPLRENDPLSHLHRGSTIAAPGHLQDSSTIEFDLHNLLPRYFVTPKTWTPSTSEQMTISNPADEPSDKLSIIRKHLVNWYRDISGQSSKQVPSQASMPAPLNSFEADEFVEVKIQGVVYTTILNPEDGRKCHIDLITAFVWAFRDNPDATLIMKMTQQDADSYRLSLNHTLHQLFPFKCRIVLFNGYLLTEQYLQLINATTFYVNTSHCEGLCIPLMEFLSSGKPVIAPKHTAMEDYIDADVAFVIETYRETNVWPHDPRGRYTTERHRNNWETIVENYKHSFEIATRQQDVYRRMSANAIQRMKKFCSIAAIENQLKTFLHDELGMKL